MAGLWKPVAVHGRSWRAHGLLSLATVGFPESAGECAARGGEGAMAASLMLLLLLADGGSALSASSQDPTPAATEPSPAEPEQAGRYGQLTLEDLLKLRIVTASQQDESLREAPVPVTVITRAMIRAIGARHLQDVLATYVPGMTVVGDHNELNVTMRGVYGSAQQKILVLLDGHRLNSRAYSQAAPDYGIRIDLERVKQIEVLRGPGSSLYGNVALTAVVNIVTASGQELDGLSLSVAGGTYASGQDADGQDTFAAGQNLGMTYGKRFSDGHDLVLWGGFFEADGQEIPVARADDFSPVPKDGFAHVNAFRKGASYDVGLRFVAGDVTLLANRRYGKLVEPFSAGGLTGEVYDPSAYRTFQNKGPGLGTLSNHLEVKYAHKASERVSFDLTGYYDTNELDGLLVSNPALTVGSFINWIDDALGGVAQLRLGYETSGGAEGDLLLGGQVDHMRLRDSNLPVQVGGEWTRFGDSRSAPLIQPGEETIYSGFGQLKHKFDERWIANAGLRLDVKDRHRGDNVTDLSPRLALVWVPTATFDMKLSYARSFVDAPYWYRYNVLPAYQGSADLKPEHLQSLQLTPSLTLKGGKLRNTLNVFYNDVSDFVFRNNAAGPNEARYANAGVLKSLGFEHETAWIDQNLRVNAALTFQTVLDSEAFAARDDRIYNVPRFACNLVVDANPLGHRSDRLWVNLNLRYTGRQLAPIESTFRLGANGVVAPFRDPGHELEPYWLANLGVRVARLGLAGASLDVTVFNLFDESYQQGGSTLFPYPQAGRSIVARLGYEFGQR